jgi:hypothetical protein
MDIRPLVMIDYHRHTYLLVKQGVKFNHLIPMDCGGLTIIRRTSDQLQQEGIVELEGYPLLDALVVFRRAAANFGITKEASHYLDQPWVG